MYQPGPFRIDDPARLQALIDRHPLCLVVVAVDGEVHANPVPVLATADGSAHGRLRFHLARGNPLCNWLDGERPALMVFSGEQHYVSPDWYASAQLVPTWNYAMVQARGIPTVLDDSGLCQLLEDLSGTHEQALKPKIPWTTDKLETALYTRMRKGIRGFEMPIDSLQGKWKMSQNRGADDRRGVIEALDRLPEDAGARQVAACMRDLGEPD